MHARLPAGRCDTALTEQIVRGQKVRTIEANGPNPHKLPGGQLYDWIGTAFIPVRHWTA
jgi:hypothetical protein